MLLGSRRRSGGADSGSVPSSRSGRVAFGDLAGAVAIAGGITATLLKRERTGEAPVVDVSLLGFAMWQLSPDIVASGLYGGDPMPKFDHFSSPNPLVGAYKTSDNRFVTLMLLQSDRFWPDLCEKWDAPELIEDPRFADAGALQQSPRADRDPRRDLRRSHAGRVDRGTADAQGCVGPGAASQ